MYVIRFPMNLPAIYINCEIIKGEKIYIVIIKDR